MENLVVDEKLFEDWMSRNEEYLGKPYIKGKCSDEELTHDEEITLLKNYRENGCIASRNRLLVSYKKFVDLVIKKRFFTEDVDLIDMLNIALTNTALMKAIDNYNIESGLEWGLKSYTYYALSRSIEKIKIVPKKWIRSDIEDDPGVLKLEKNSWIINIENEKISKTFDCAVIIYPQDSNINYCLIL